MLDSAQTEIRKQRKLKAAYLTLITGIVLLGIKFTAFFITQSAAIFSDAAESIINVATAIFGIVSLKIALRPPDEDHPYGHGKAEYFSSGFEGLLVIIAGFVIGFEAMRGFFNPAELSSLSTGLLLIVGAGAVNAFLGWYLISTGKKFSSPTLIGSGYHVLSDAYTSLGVLIGLILVMVTDIWWFDPLVALLVGIQIIWHGFSLIKASTWRLMDSADEDSEKKISKALERERETAWIAPHKLRSWRSGDRLFVDLHVIMPFYFSVEQAHNIEHNIQEVIQHAFDEQVEVLIHREPCNPDCCFLCGVTDCPERSHPFSGLKKWNRDVLNQRLDAQLSSFKSGNNQE
jgi:cation diffusion facilitator family transporter